MPDFIDRADVGMVQRRSGTGFPAEAVQRLRVLCNVVRKEFQGNEAPEIEVFCFVDHSHAAAAQLLDNAVVRNGLPNHWIEILGLRLEQVNEGEEVGAFSKRWWLKILHYAH